MTKGGGLYHWSLTDVHGGTGNRGGTMGVELYGNYIDSNGYEIHMHKGGGARLLIHHNYAAENVDNEEIMVKWDTLGTPTLSRERMNNTYSFQNFVQNITNVNLSLLNTKYFIVDNHDNQIVENSTFWMDDPECIEGLDTSGCSPINNGVGCGSTLPTNCTPSSDVSIGSTAFWLTDQSCTSLSGLTGASTAVSGGNRNPSSYIQGTLYKCTATNTWTAWYTPLAYPHPLRAEASDTIPPSAPTGVIVN